MEEGKREFLEKGFNDASLRNIVKRAGVTTGAFYGYYRDKEAFFEAMVSPAVNGLMKLLLSAHKSFDELPQDVKKSCVYTYSISYHNELVSYIYDHFTEFKLLITCSGGTAFSDFINSLVEAEEEATLRFVESTGNDALSSGRATPELIHIISSAYFSAVFEVVAHDMTREAADSYIESLRQFFTAGWKTILTP
ncbi:TetR/AcrR family transcriptional regulator [Anaerobacterium chartisolvens]|nr:TetR/AcrR family transcriptional regulator [Anaerobacterium chartisolvens]